MSINCSKFCLYQVEGNCSLNNSSLEETRKNKLEESSCPYFSGDNFYNKLM